LFKDGDVRALPGGGTPLQKPGSLGAEIRVIKRYIPAAGDYPDFLVPADLKDDFIGEADSFKDSQQVMIIIFTPGADLEVKI
jgi:hypothetical protein